MKNITLENELYEPMRVWLYNYLTERYKNAKILTIDSHARSLDTILTELDYIKAYPQIVGLNIQIDVLGIISDTKSTNLVFIEAKKTKLNLHDLGQLWVYCKLCNPIEAFLLSPLGLGSLSNILINLQRVDLLNYSNTAKIKMIKIIQVGQWDILTNSIKTNTLIPKL